MTDEIGDVEIQEEWPEPVIFGGPLRRVTDLQVANGADAALAVQIGTLGRVGTLQGVDVNFTHDDLPANEWWARPWWYVWGDGEERSGLIFPSEAAHDAELRKLGVSREPIYARKGDLLTISRVQQVQEVSYLHHPHDYSVRYAHLKLTRRDGSVIDNIGPLAFYGNTRLINHGSREAFDNAIARIAAIHPKGLQQYGRDIEAERPDWKNGADTVARHHAGRAHDALFELIDSLDPNETHIHVRLRTIVNASVLAGFALAKHEMKQAQDWEAAREANRQNATAKARELAESDQKIEAAKECWRINPKLTTNAVSEILINSRWPNAYPASISRTIKQFAPPMSPSHKSDIYEPWS